MKYYIFIASFLLAGTGTAGAGMGTKILDECSRGGASRAEMQQCLFPVLESQRRLLNKSYNEALKTAKLDDEIDTVEEPRFHRRVATLVASQKAYQMYLNSEIERIHANVTGNGSEVSAAMRELDLNQSRIDELGNK